MTADVLATRTDSVSEAMRVALRIMEERVTLVARMAEDARQTGRGAVAELYEGRALEYSRYAGVLRQAASASIRETRTDHPDEP
jgi:two-component system chemotaxis response regulator CheB